VLDILLLRVDVSRFFVRVDACLRTDRIFPRALLPVTWCSPRALLTVTWRSHHRFPLLGIGA